MSRKETRRQERVLIDLSAKEIDEILAFVSRRDRKLAQVIELVESGFSFRVDELQEPLDAAVFAAIAEAIVYQQLTGKAAATIWGRVKTIFGGDSCPRPAQILSTPDTVLRAAGLSRSKINALKDLADKAENGLIPNLSQIQQMSDEKVVDVLSQVKGVGRWTAQMFLIFRLGRPDVMPSNDYGVRKGFAWVYGHKDELPTPAFIEEHAEKWRPYRTVASWYMWRATELEREANKRTQDKNQSLKTDASQKHHLSKKAIKSQEQTPPKKALALKKTGASRKSR